MLEGEGERRNEEESLKKTVNIDMRLGGNEQEGELDEYFQRPMNTERPPT
jgi:hypothetical protein